jgi:hypothetical protein
MIISMEHYVELIKFHEEQHLSTNLRNKFWKELKDELVKKQTTGADES